MLNFLQKQIIACCDPLGVIFASSVISSPAGELVTDGLSDRPACDTLSSDLSADKPELVQEWPKGCQIGWNSKLSQQDEQPVDEKQKGRGESLRESSCQKSIC